MNKLIAIIPLLGLVTVARAEVPGIITYQGRVTSHGTNFTGAGQFKFALLDGNGPSLWSNNGSSVNGSEPTAAVTVPVTNGLFTVALGDTNLAGMNSVIPATAFDNAIVRLRIWFNDGTTGFAPLSPDQRLTAVGYALRSDNVLDGAITGPKLANGAVGPVQLADGAVLTPKLVDGAVTPAKIPDDSITGQKIAPNSLASEDITDTLRLRDLDIESAGGLDRVELTEANNSGVLYMNHGSIGRFLEASGTTQGGFLRLYDALGGIGVGQTTVELGSSSVGGYVRVLQDNASTGVQINGQNGTTAGGNILLYREAGLGLNLQASTSAGQGSLLTMYNGLGDTTVYLDADASGRSCVLQMYQTDGTPSITLDASDAAGEGRITTQVLEITGGSDLSEQFEVQSPVTTPGMIVCIDPDHPGELAVSQRAYDRTVAGVVSGAGGVKPGLLMGQHNTKADGRHPVALTGRVYCLMDASTGAIEPGDLITTSDVPGHGMKVTDRIRAPGAIVGKAMTGLAHGRGLVLVLVSLQ